MEALPIQATGVMHDSDCQVSAGIFDADSESTSPFSGLAALAVAVVALSLAVLPAAIALRVLALPPGGVMVALECLGAGLLGAKLIAIVVAVFNPLLEAHPAGAAVATPD
jgi:hypothetical protein